VYKRIAAAAAAAAAAVGNDTVVVGNRFRSDKTEFFDVSPDSDSNESSSNVKPSVHLGKTTRLCEIKKLKSDRRQTFKVVLQTFSTILKRRKHLYFAWKLLRRVLY
jgi:hypothetical protein